MLRRRGWSKLEEDEHIRKLIQEEKHDLKYDEECRPDEPYDPAKGLKALMKRYNIRNRAKVAALHLPEPASDLDQLSRTMLRGLLRGHCDMDRVRGRLKEITGLKDLHVRWIRRIGKESLLVYPCCSKAATHYEVEINRLVITDGSVAMGEASMLDEDGDDDACDEILEDAVICWLYDSFNGRGYYHADPWKGQ